ncbi:hypothetical protein F5148DRAFT_805926 [Russula earlei]|uniref:Uncharacterized protein n=1 Tax=Russula earlei TaxID=71964 RepID=A0ACC0UBR3_9AGAM|nr:hypothetical protein F5148DRAFT_805926 [Russula earlei]
MTSVASPSDPHAVADHLPPRSSKSLLASTWQVLDQPPPPTLREILGAYRSRGDGDREMLMAMLNAKSAEDQRIASVASLHRSMLEYYQTSRQAHEPPHAPVSEQAAPSHPGGAHQSPGSPHVAAPTPHFAHHQDDSPNQPRRAHARPYKRIRASESPSSTYRSIPSSYTPSPPPRPSSAYSSRSDSLDQSPRLNAMAIGSLLAVGAQQTRDDIDGASQHDAMCADRSQLRR